ALRRIEIDLPWRHAEGAREGAQLLEYGERRRLPVQTDQHLEPARPRLRGGQPARPRRRQCPSQGRLVGPARDGERHHRVAHTGAVRHTRTTRRYVAATTGRPMTAARPAFTPNLQAASARNRVT